uniref:Uncharacterized protein n=1 Tax=Strigamia maritima TaxID=126957 RepID=T1J9R8_STRMM
MAKQEGRRCAAGCNEADEIHGVDGEDACRLGSHPIAIASADIWLVRGGVMKNENYVLGMILTCICYLADEYQGVFMGLLPATSRSPPMLSEVMVVADGIPIWGECYRKIGNSVILREREQTQCFRCIVILVRSNNVLQVYSHGLEKCYMDEESARTSCPTESSIASKTTKEIMLYKKPNPEIVVLQSYCPINGRFKATYSSNVDRNRHCQVPTAEFSNCPYGFSLCAKFKQCSFPDEELHYQCLGDWEGPNEERYLALLEGQPNAPINPTENPKYRCAMYYEDKSSGKISLALSGDSTCTNDHLMNSSMGAETYSLMLTLPPSWPPIALVSECRFPPWAQGPWTNLEVEGGIITFKDHRNFKTYTIKCMTKEVNPQQDRFKVYMRSQCGDELYTCLELSHRSDHIIEFQIGQFPEVQYNDSICHDKQFNSKSWITLGRQGLVPDTPCPIAGEYTGLVPDAPRICAKLASDCNNPDIMFYTASNCLNRSEIYEEREYKCLGQWEENGLTYTYTERRDVNGFQCFLGTIISETVIQIMEADVNCMRGIDLSKFGMQMTKKADCDFGLPPVTLPTSSRGTSLPGKTFSPTRREHTTRKSIHITKPPTPPWEIISDTRHPVNYESGASQLTWQISLFFCLLAIYCV